MFEVDTGGRRRTIDVRRSGRDWTVIVDGRPMRVNLARAGHRWSMLVRPSESGERPGTPEAQSDWAKGGWSHEVAIEMRGRGSRIVWVDGRAVSIVILDPRRRVGPTRQSGSASTTGPIAIASPMPGRVVKLLIAPGDVVAARQGLVVVEAMKMENELRAPRDGTIAEVRVQEGEAVEASTVLVVLQ